MALCYAISLVMFIVGAAFFTGKAASHIKSYKMMPDEEKKKINIKALSRNLSVMFFIASLILLIAGYSAEFRTTYFKWAMLGWMVLCCIDLVYIGKSGRYEKNA